MLAASAGVHAPQLADRVDRLDAKLIDLLALGVAAGLVPEVVRSYTDTSVAAAVQAALLVVLLAVQAFLLTTTGQTIGKRLRKIRIVRTSGEQAGFVRSVLLRFAVPCLVMVGTGLWFGMVDIHFGSMSSPTFLMLADLLPIFGMERRCLHDVLAGTHVIRAR